MKYLILLLLLTSCGKQMFLQQGSTENFFSADFIKKQDFLFKNRMEGTPFVWNGTLHYAISNRMTDNSIEIYDGENLISSTPSGVYMFSVLVVDNELILVGSNFEQLLITRTTDLINWSTPQVILTHHQIFNSSLTKTPNGFVLAYEVCEENTTCFSARFLQSNDLVTWTSVGTIFKPNIYAACPTIRFVDGYYYVFYLRHMNGIYVTAVSRSTDLVSWEDSQTLALTPNRTTEGQNNSDMDFIEYNGHIEIQYAIGNQDNGLAPWSDIKRATFDGTMEDFVSKFY